MNKERRLIILASRVFDLTDQEAEIKSLILDKALKWDLILKYLCKTKTTGLFWKSIKLLQLDLIVPVNARRLLEFYYWGNYERNKVLLDEFSQLYETILSSKIKVAPLKGILLLQSIYKDLGTRQLNDIDLLVSYKDKDSLDSLLLEYGYQHGKLAYGENRELTINKLERFEEIIWKTKMNSLPPFYKVLNNRWCEVIDIDCSFAYDYQMRFDDVTDIIDNKLIYDGEIFRLNDEDFFIQLCCHLYKEASNASWALLGNDLNLIKFCDVREFWYEKINKNTWERICQKAIALGYEKAVYYTLYFCELIYDDKIDVNYQKDLHIKDKEFLFQFGQREYGKLKVWKADFFERLFEGSFNEIYEEKGNFPLIK